MITIEYANHNGVNVFGLSWLFVNTNPITLMEQLENVPSMFHQNLRCLETKTPASS